MGNFGGVISEKRPGSRILDRLRGASYQTAYAGEVRIKFVEDGHEYYVSELGRVGMFKGWSDWKRVYGSTTFIEIKDKSNTLIDWAVGLFYRYTKKILGIRLLNKFDLEFARNLHADKKKQAGNIGTIAHKWMENWIRNNNPVMPEHPSVLQIITAFWKWKNDLKVEFVATEILLYSKEHKYCGTADAIVRIGGKLYLLDFKTGSGIYNDCMLQTASYVKMYYEMGLNKIYGELVGRVVVRFEKRTEEEFREEMMEKGRPNAIYRPITTLFFDNSPEQLEDDYNAFLCFKGGWEWNKRSERALKKIKDLADITIA